MDTIDKTSTTDKTVIKKKLSRIQRRNLVIKQYRKKASRQALTTLADFADTKLADESVEKINEFHVLKLIWLSLHIKGLTTTFDKFKTNAMLMLEQVKDINLKNPITVDVLQKYYDKKIDQIKRFRSKVIAKKGVKHTNNGEKDIKNTEKTDNSTDPKLIFLTGFIKEAVNETNMKNLFYSNRTEFNNIMKKWTTTKDEKDIDLRGVNSDPTIKQASDLYSKTTAAYKVNKWI